jgi:hypothetical protein
MQRIGDAAKVVKDGTVATLRFVAGIPGWCLRLSRMSRQEWRDGAANVWKHTKEGVHHYWVRVSEPQNRLGAACMAA